ncbi:hypothetical protein LguiA_034309 [Lonicera macranthoides]
MSHKLDASSAYSSYDDFFQQLRQIGLSEALWNIVIVLTPRDVNHSQCRLLLPESDIVEKHILGSMQRSNADQCRSADGLTIEVSDVDEESRQFELCLKRWPSTNPYVLTGRWIQDFVIRKGLQKGDKVGLTYRGSKLYFKHFKNH